MTNEYKVANGELSKQSGIISTEPPLTGNEESDGTGTRVYCIRAEQIASCCIAQVGRATRDYLKQIQLHICQRKLQYWLFCNPLLELDRYLQLNSK